MNNNPDSIDAHSAHQSGDVDENSLRILDLLAEEPYVSQRELSEKVGLSVGLINLIIKRLATTGYIKISNLNPKKVGYFLTKMGLSEQMRRSYYYLNKTIQTYKNVMNRTDQLILNLKEKGHKKFVIVGEGEIADLVTQSFRRLNDPAITWTHVPAEPPKESEKEAVILDARFGDNGTPGISVLSTLMNIKQHQVFDFSPLDASQGEQLP